MIHEAPPATAESVTFWREARAHRLSLPYCEACARWIWFPRSRCDQCGGTPQWNQLAGTARLESFATERRATVSRWRERVPYVIGLVRLDEGVTMLTNIVSCQPGELAIGLRLRVAFEPTTDPELFVPVFAPVPAGPPREPSG